MFMKNKPLKRTDDNRFSSGPCKKRPNWDLNLLKNALVGRSHKSTDGKNAFAEILKLQREVLEIPDDYIVATIMGSDTAAVEAAIWNLIGERGVDAIVFDYFGKKWKDDVVERLQLKDCREFKANYGFFPSLDDLDCDRDILFCYNGTTSGSCVNNLDFIKKNRKGLVICDATSAAFAYNIDFEKIDVFCYSWQKV